MTTRRSPSPETRAKIARGMAAYRARKLDVAAVDSLETLEVEATPPEPVEADEPVVISPRRGSETNDSGMFWRRTPRHLLGKR